MVNLCFDDVASSPTLGYPNLASPNLAPDEFDITWPRVLPLRLLVYFSRFNLPFRVHDVRYAPCGSWYPVALGWHDFECDYFSLMPETTKNRLRQKEIKVLFYYHEGDNPSRIQSRFDSLCLEHNLPSTAYLLITANTAVDDLEHGYYFPDHEYFFQYVNRRQDAPAINDRERFYKFTALTRTHKWWRASVMSDLHRSNLLENSLWSYNTDCAIDDPENENPIQLDIDPVWRQDTYNFIDRGPYWCDDPNHKQHNDHRIANTSLYQESYCHVVIETLFDADQSDGAFLTEKTYKCLKYGQPFVIVGTANSLQTLKNRGYHVFDHAIDNTYDQIIDNTKRWLAIKETLKQIKSQDMHQWFLSCLDDVRYNQELFLRQQGGAVEDLWHKLATDTHTI